MQHFYLFNDDRYILFVSRAGDAITDPVYGYFIDKSKTFKIGKMKPW